MFYARTFGALKIGFRSFVTIKLVVNVVGKLYIERTAAASRAFLPTDDFLVSIADVVSPMSENPKLTIRV